MERYNRQTVKMKDTTVSLLAARWALSRMFRALSDNFGIARVLARLRHNEEEIPVHEEDLQALASIHERVNMNFALCGSLFSGYRNANDSMGGGGYEQVHRSIEETRRNNRPSVGRDRTGTRTDAWGVGATRYPWRHEGL